MAGIKTQLIDPIRPKNDRSRILHEIYESNRSMHDLRGILKRKVAARRIVRVRRWLTPAVLLIAIAGFALPALIRQEREISPVVNTGAAATIVSPVGQDTAADAVVNVGEVKSLEIGGDIPLSQMLNLGIRHIVLDAGHGGSDPGTIGRGGTKEKNITLAVAMKMREQLLKLGVADTRMTRTGDVTVSLQERMDYAKEAKADMFVSIHVNSLPMSKDNTTETFYFGPSDDTRTLQLVDRENMGSEYGLSDFMEIVERLGKTLKLQESKKLADTIQKALYLNTKEFDPGTIDSGVKKAPFVVLMGLNVPSVLAEIACMSNEKAERDMNSEEYQHRIAAALVSGIMSYQNMGVVKNGSR